MRLIDADALEKEIISERNKIPETLPCASYELVNTKPNRDGQLIKGGLRKALRCLNDAPTVDAVPVVRCIDCVYWDGRGWDGRCEAPSNGLIRDYVNYDDYCSYGERKEQE